MKVNYLDKHGLGTLISLIKRGQTGVYVVKGTAIYADAAFLALSSAEKEAIDTGASAIDAAGLWQKTSGAYAQVTTFEEGDVYDIINAFTTDANFREGAGYPVEAGMNIVSVNTGTAATPVLMWDLFSGLLNLDKYQTKELVNAAGIEVFQNETPTVYTASTSLPTSETAASATITDLMVAVLGTGNEEGDVYRAHVTPNASDPTLNDIVWVKLGNQLTVEGMLEFLGHTCPNTPITDSEIEYLWNNA